MEDQSITDTHKFGLGPVNLQAELFEGNEQVSVISELPTPLYYLYYEPDSRKVFYGGVVVHKSSLLLAVSASDAREGSSEWDAGEKFARDREQCDATIVAVGQLISLTLPKGKYNAPPPIVRQRLRDPHKVYDLCELEDDVNVPSLQQHCQHCHSSRTALTSAGETGVMEQSGLVVECLYILGQKDGLGAKTSASALAGACFPLVELERLIVVLGSCLFDCRLIAPEFVPVMLDRDVAFIVKALIRVHVPSQMRSSSVVHNVYCVFEYPGLFGGQVLFSIEDLMTSILKCCRY